MDYVICASPRTGSNLLGHGLRTSGLGGAPLEAFDPPEIAARGFPESAELDLDAYVRALREERTGPNGVFGIKTHYHQAQAQVFSRGRSLLDLLDRPQHIHILRLDKLAQAISWLRARQTQQYVSGQARLGEARYEFVTLAALLVEAALEQERWRRYFAGAGLTPLTLTYEQLDADYPGTVARLLRRLGLACADLEIPPPRMARQADAQSAQWSGRFVQDLLGWLERGAKGEDASSEPLQLAALAAPFLLASQRDRGGPAEPWNRELERRWQALRARGQ